MQPLRVRHGQRAGAQVPREQPPQVPACHAEPCRQVFDAAVVERAIGDQSQSAPHRRRGATPRGRSGCAFGTAAQAGPVARLTGGGRGRKERHVLAPRRVGRADRPAVDSRTEHTGEETQVVIRPQRIHAGLLQLVQVIRSQAVSAKVGQVEVVTWHFNRDLLCAEVHHQHLPHRPWYWHGALLPRQSLEGFAAAATARAATDRGCGTQRAPRVTKVTRTDSSDSMSWTNTSQPSGSWRA